MASCRPNRAVGSRSEVLIQEERCWGTVSETEEALGFEVASETLRTDINRIESQLIRADRMTPPGQQGQHRPGGEINGELQPNGAWPLIMAHTLLGSVTTTGSGPYQHVIEGSLEYPDNVDGLTLEKKFGLREGQFKYLQYWGSMVNTQSISIPNEGIITASAQFVSKREEEVLASMDAAPTWPSNNEPFNSFEGQISMDLAGDGVREDIATLRSFNRTINNNLSPDEFALDGTQYRADIAEGVRGITGDFEAFFTLENWALYQRHKDNATISLRITMTKGTYMWREVYHSIKIQVPTPQISGRGPINLNGSFMAHRNDAEGTQMTCTIINNDSVISTAA